MRSGTAAGRMAKSRDAGRRANYANEAPSPRFGVDKVNKSGRVDAITSLYRVFFSFFFYRVSRSIHDGRHERSFRSGFERFSIFIGFYS